MLTDIHKKMIDEYYLEIEAKVKPFLDKESLHYLNE